MCLIVSCIYLLFVVFLVFLAYAVKPEASYRVRQSDGKRAYAGLWMLPALTLPHTEKCADPRNPRQVYHNLYSTYAKSAHNGALLMYCNYALKIP